MTNTASNEYLKNAVMTASQEQLQLMLYDGAIRFAQQGKEALIARDLENACEKLLKAQRIISEMKNGLRPEANPAICEQLGKLYGFIYWRLVEANTKHDPAIVDEALQILHHQRETWRLLMDKVQKEVPAADGRSIPSQKAAEHQPLSLEC